MRQRLDAACFNKSGIAEICHTTMCAVQHCWRAAAAPQTLASALPHHHLVLELSSDWLLLSFVLASFSATRLAFTTKEVYQLSLVLPCTLHGKGGVGQVTCFGPKLVVTVTSAAIG